MSYPIHVPEHGIKAEPADGLAIGYSAADGGGRVVFSTPDGHRSTVAKEGLVGFTVSGADRKTIVAHYETVRPDQYCCVTCNGFTFCGEAPCCGGPNGTDNCC